VWSTSTGGMLSTLPTVGVEVSLLRFSRDGTRLAVMGCDERTFVHCTASGAELACFGKAVRHRNEHAMAWSPDGTRIAVATSRDFRVWDVTTGMMHMKLPLHGHSCDWSGDGSRLLVACPWEPFNVGGSYSYDTPRTHVRVIDAGTGLPLELFVHDGRTGNAAFASHDGTRVMLFAPGPARSKYTPDDSSGPSGRPIARTFAV